MSKTDLSDAVLFLVEELRCIRNAHARMRKATLDGDKKVANEIWFSNAQRLRNVWRILKEQEDETN